MAKKKQDADAPKQADPADGDAAPAEPAGPAEEARPEAQSPMMVNAQYVKDLSFENPNAPDSLRQMGQAPELGVNVDVRARNISEKVFEVELKISSEAKHDGKVAFIVECAYAGIFTLGPEVKDEMMRPLLFIEAPRMLFPFARAIVADAVRDGGFPPLLVHPVDFVHLYRQRMAQEKAQAGNGGAKPDGGDGAAE